MIGVVLIAAPHVIGAPPPADVATNVPESLWHDFVVAVTVTSFLFWVTLGGVTGALAPALLARMKPVLASGLGAIAEAYDVAFCDIWGVIHNGHAVFPAPPKP